MASPSASERATDDGELLGGMDEEGNSPSKEVVKREMAEFLKD